jgi:transposase
MVHTMKDERAVSRPVRRVHDRAFKANLVWQSLQPGASVSAIALAGGINANLLFKWRRDHLRSTSAAAPAVLLPVAITPEVVPTPAPVACRSVARPGVIELEISGVQLRVRGAVDEASLGSVLRALRSNP